MNEIMVNEGNIKAKIYTIRGLQVMLDSDLAELYGVETKVFNQAVKRNEKFNKLFEALEDKTIKPKQGIFYNEEVVWIIKLSR